MLITNVTPTYFCGGDHARLRAVYGTYASEYQSVTCTRVARAALPTGPANPAANYVTQDPFGTVLIHSFELGRLSSQWFAGDFDVCVSGHAGSQRGEPVGHFSHRRAERNQCATGISSPWPTSDRRPERRPSGPDDQPVCEHQRRH